jgi:hypothetical protein
MILSETGTQPQAEPEGKLFQDHTPIAAAPGALLHRAWGL